MVGRSESAVHRLRNRVQDQQKMDDFVEIDNAALICMNACKYSQYGLEIPHNSGQQIVEHI